MKLCIISGSQGDDVRQIFLEAGKRFFEKVVYAPLDKITIECQNGETKIFFKSTDVSTFDVVLVRAFNDDFMFAEVLLDALETTNVYLPHSLDGYQITNHKFHSVERVARIGVPVPDSSLTVTPEAALETCVRFGFPVVLKLLRGFGGKGVMLLKSESELKPVLDTLKVFNEFPSAQRFIESSGKDIRALVIGDEVVGIQRASEGPEWRANVSSGGKAKIIELREDIAKMAKKTADLLGMDVCGVDFIMSEKGPYFIEANFSPGVMPKYFGDELAVKIMKFLRSQV